MNVSRLGIPFCSPIAGGLAFAWLAWSVPAGGPIQEGFAEFQKLTQSTHQQLETLHEQVQSLRRKELVPATEAAKQYAVSLQGQIKVNNEALKAVRDASSALALQVRSLKSEQSRQAIAAIQAGLRATADTIDNRVCRTAEEAARQFDQLATDLGGDLERLATLVETTPVELDKPITQIIDGLGQAEAVLEVASQALDPAAFDNMAKMCKSLSEALWNSGNTWYMGLVTDKKALRDASVNLDALIKRIEQMGAAVPQVKQSADDARAKLRALRDEIAEAHNSRQSLDAFVRGAKKTLANAARSAPAILKSTSATLRETSRLRDVATAMRATAAMLDQVDSQWASIAATLDTTAKLLEKSASASDTLVNNPHALEHQAEVVLAGTVATAEFLNSGVRSLDRLQSDLLFESQSVGRISELLPGYAHSIGQLLSATWWCLWLASAVCFVVAGLHWYSQIERGTS